MKNDDTNDDHNSPVGGEKSKARISADWATVLIGVIGIPLLFWQGRLTQKGLELTRESNQMTREALDDARKSRVEDSAASASADAESLRRFNESLAQAQKGMDAAAKQAIAARDAQRLEMRAWVLPGEPARIDLESIPAVISMPFANTGRTPAKNLSVTGRVEYGTKEPTLPAFDGGGSRATLGAGASFSFQGLTSNLGISKEDLMGGRKRLFLSGVIRYEDVFGGHNLTTYCLVLDGRSGGWTIYKTLNDVR